MQLIDTVDAVILGSLWNLNHGGIHSFSNNMYTQRPCGAGGKKKGITAKMSNQEWSSGPSFQQHSARPVYVCAQHLRYLLLLCLKGSWLARAAHSDRVHQNWFSGIILGCR